MYLVVEGCVIVSSEQFRTPSAVRTDCYYCVQHLEGKRREGDVRVAIESHSDDEHLQVLVIIY